jgi:hypothetical protein
MLQRIVSAVYQAVVASIHGVGSPHPPPRSEATTATELREVPVVESRSNIVVPTPVASALDNVTGETNFIEVSPPQPALPSFHSVDVPIDASVNPKIKAKIWAHEFIDFGILRNSGAGDTCYHLSVNSPHGSSLPTLSIELSHKPKAIPHIGAWTSAFQIFVAVYTSKFPLDALALMKYSEVVRDLATRGADWRFYDTQFRMLRHSNPADFPWGSTHWELWIRAQNFNTACFSKAQAPVRSNASPARPLVPKGFCRKFHRGNDCSGCNFRPQQSTTHAAPAAAKSRSTNPSSN